MVGAADAQNGPLHVPKTREKQFHNGDRFKGGWLNGLPEGEGRYEWSDGSCYEGGWKAGHKHGVGKYTWNSGASYQGDWHHGFMHGVGTFEAPDGSKYQGGWHEDLKHGLGRKIYANGDVYEGLWHNGKPDGPGRYIWTDFNEYDGEWRSGRLHGQGTFVWKTGERYDGEWKAGHEDGVGVFTFKDGSSYEGFWHKGKKHGVGIFLPAPSSSSAAACASNTPFLTGKDSSKGRSQPAGSQAPLTSSGRSAFADATAAAAALPDEAAADFAQPKRPDKPVSEPGALETQLQPRLPGGGAGSVKSAESAAQTEQQGSMAPLPSSRNRRDQVVLKEYNEGRLVRQQVLTPALIAAISSALAPPAGGSSSSSSVAAGSSARGSSSSNSRQQVTPQGHVMYKGHSAYDLMVQLQLGIRWSVSSAALDYNSPAASNSKLQPPDYATMVSQGFPRAGSRSTPVHPAADFVWKDYAPAAFRMLRESAGIEQHEFINQVCSDQSLQLLTPPGHSDAMFFLSADGRFLVRTIPHTEKRLLLSVLQRYAEHMQKYPRSLLVRFYGVHRVSAPAVGADSKVYLLVMGNILSSQLPLQRCYDLKGCTKGRTVGPAAAKAAGPGVVLKDMDLQQSFKLPMPLSEQVHTQLDLDTHLLASLRVMNYSLLLGVQQDTAAGGSVGTQPSKQPPPQQQQQSFVEHNTAAGVSAAAAGLEAQLKGLQLDKWAASALLQMARANLLLGLAAAGSSHGRRGAASPSPTLLLATRPQRSNQRRQPAAAAAAAAPAGTGAAEPGGAAGAGAASAQPLKNGNSSNRESMRPFGLGVAAVAMPAAASSKRASRDGAAAAAAGKQPQEQQLDVVLFFGIIDFLQAYTLRKQLESYLRRVVSSASAISAVGPRFYASRFRTALKKVLQ